MQMRARVRATMWIDVDSPDVPEIELSDHGRGNPARPAFDAVNEDKVLAARRAAAKAAEKQARALFPDADVVVEEVVER